MVTEAPDTALEDRYTLRPLACIEEDANRFLPDDSVGHGISNVLVTFLNKEDAIITEHALMIASKKIGGACSYHSESLALGGPIPYRGVGTIPYVGMTLIGYVKDTTRISSFTKHFVKARITYPNGAVRTYHLND